MDSQVKGYPQKGFLEVEASQKGFHQRAFACLLLPANQRGFPELWQERVRQRGSLAGSPSQRDWLVGLGQKGWLVGPGRKGWLVGPGRKGWLVGPGQKD